MNNNFIPAEEFLKQSEKVQGNIKDWLEENMQEKEWIKFIEEGGELSVDSVLDTRKDNINVGRVFYIDKCFLWTSIHETNVVPLLQMHQLINFIQDKTNCKVEMDTYKERGYELYLHSFEQGKREYNHEPYSNLGFDLLNALWLVAIQIAK